MRVLLAVSQDSNPKNVANYLSKRFRKEDIYVDILTVIPDDRKSFNRNSSVYEKAAQTANSLANMLREKHGIGGVFTHIENGDIANVILSSSRRWRSSIVLIEAPRQRGLLTAFKKDGVARQLFNKINCSLELIRTETADQSDVFKILLPLHLDQLESFPIRKIQEMGWMRDSNILILAVQNASIPESQTEASPAAILRSIQENKNAKQQAENRLISLSLKLKKALNDLPEVTFEIQEGNLRDITSETANKIGASLVVTHGDKKESLLKRVSPFLSPATLAMSSSCSVLMLYDKSVNSNTNGRMRPSTYLAMSSN